MRLHRLALLSALLIAPACDSDEANQTCAYTDMPGGDYEGQLALSEDGLSWELGTSAARLRIETTAKTIDGETSLPLSKPGVYAVDDQREEAPCHLCVSITEYSQNRPTRYYAAIAGEIEITEIDLQSQAASAQIRGLRLLEKPGHYPPLDAADDASPETDDVPEQEADAPHAALWCIDEADIASFPGCLSNRDCTEPGHLCAPDIRSCVEYIPCEGDEEERPTHVRPNTASPIDLGETRDTKICANISGMPRTEERYFSYHQARAQDVEIVATFNQRLHELTLELLDQEGHPLTPDTSKPLPLSLQFSELPAGDYYIRVTNSVLPIANAFPYTLKVHAP